MNLGSRCTGERGRLASNLASIAARNVIDLSLRITEDPFGEAPNGAGAAPALP